MSNDSTIILNSLIKLKRTNHYSVNSSSSLSDKHMSLSHSWCQGLLSAGAFHPGLFSPPSRSTPPQSFFFVPQFGIPIIRCLALAQPFQYTCVSSPGQTPLVEAIGDIIVEIIMLRRLIKTCVVQVIFSLVDFNMFDSLWWIFFIIYACTTCFKTCNIFTFKSRNHRLKSGFDSYLLSWKFLKINSPHSSPVIGLNGLN